jgi:hypothetical protein
MNDLAYLGGTPESQKSGLYFLMFFLLLLYCGYNVAFTKFFPFIIVEFTPSIILPYPPAPILGIVSPDLYFPFTYMRTYFCHIHPPTPFPCILPLPTGLILLTTFHFALGGQV